MKRVEALDPLQPEALWYLGLSEAQHRNLAAATAYWQRLLACSIPPAGTTRWCRTPWRRSSRRTDRAIAGCFMTDPRPPSPHARPHPRAAGNGGASAMNEASAADLLRALRGLVASGAVRIELDLKRLDHMDSPVGVEADSNIWVYGSIPICAGVFWQLGPWAGIAAVVVSLALYFTLAAPMSAAAWRGGSRSGRCRTASCGGGCGGSAGSPWSSVRAARAAVLPPATGWRWSAASRRTSPGHRRTPRPDPRGDGARHHGSLQSRELLQISPNT